MDLRAIVTAQSLTADSFSSPASASSRAKISIPSSADFFGKLKFGNATRNDFT